MEIIVDTPDLRISFEAGVSQEVVVAFAGIGYGLGGIVKEEFAKTLRDGRDSRSTYFVIDKTRSWFNRTASEIVRLLERRLNGTTRVVTLGNSMGGFGALLFAELLPHCSASIAFAPQFSVNPAHAPFETRWREYVDKIGEWLLPTCVRAPIDGCRRHVFVGRWDAADLRHAALLSNAFGGAVSVWVVNDCGHDVAAHLKQHGALRAVIEAASEVETADGVGKALTDAAIPFAMLDRLDVEPTC